VGRGVFTRLDTRERGEAVIERFRVPERQLDGDPVPREVRRRLERLFERALDAHAGPSSNGTGTGSSRPGGNGP
jgi:hypothetical protein